MIGCGHGGGGGGGIGVRGLTAALNTPQGINTPPINTTGTPEQDQFLDLGYEKGANTTSFSTAGGGGLVDEGGPAGLQGSLYEYLDGQVFQVVSSFVDYIDKVEGASPHRNGSNGQQYQGGSGGSSKRGGGGGGGGYFGGGGGGGGIEGERRKNCEPVSQIIALGSGGGGGSSYFNSNMVYIPQPSTLGLDILPAKMQPLLVLFVTYDSISFQWNHPVFSPGGDPRYYLIEIALGTGNDDYALIGTIPGSGNLQYTQTALQSNVIYRARICAVSQRGGSSEWSDPTEVATLPYPLNKWSRLYERWLVQALPGGGLQLVDPPSDQTRTIPSPRRGHSAVMIQGYMYMFGGLSYGYVCEYGTSAFCHVNIDGSGTFLSNGTVLATNSSVNELWRLDPLTWEWKQLVPLGTAPPPREQHSASVANSMMYIFGGRSNSNDSVGMNDFWVMSTNLVQSYTITSSGINSNLPIQDGRNSFSRVNVTLANNTCISGVTVKLSLNHNCTRDLSIWLLGPGPEELSATWKYANGNKDNRVKLFDSYDGTSTSSCGVNLVNTIFDDAAAVDINSCCPSPFSGSFQPVDKLSQFLDIPATGQWTLQIYDKNLNNIEGTLLNWQVSEQFMIASLLNDPSHSIQLSFSYSPCTSTYTWAKVNPTNGGPSTRYGSTSVALNNVIYVFGGFSNQRLTDLWAYFINQNSWKQLTPVNKDPDTLRMN